MILHTLPNTYFSFNSTGRNVFRVLLVLGIKTILIWSGSNISFEAAPDTVRILMYEVQMLSYVYVVVPRSCRCTYLVPVGVEMYLVAVDVRYLVAIDERYIVGCTSCSCTSYV